MNKAVIILTDCHDCQHCDHTGSYGSVCYYVCHHKDVQRKSKEYKGRSVADKTTNKVDAEYHWLSPILARRNNKTGMHIDIPNWCPYCKKD